MYEVLKLMIFPMLLVFSKCSNSMLLIFIIDKPWIVWVVLIVWMGFIVLSVIINFWEYQEFRYLFVVSNIS